MKEKYEEWMRQCGWSCNGWIPSRKRKNKKMSLCVTFLKAWGYKREWFMTPHSRFSWCMSTQKWKKTSRKYRILVHKIRIIASWHRIIISVCFFVLSHWDQLAIRLGKSTSWTRPFGEAEVSWIVGGCEKIKRILNTFAVHSKMTYCFC